MRESTKRPPARPSLDPPPTIELQLGLLVPSSDPVYLKRQMLLRHTLVLAQSGSGKSFFLSRLLEEVICKTSARVLILDPNSDFVRLSQIQQTAWTDPALKALFRDNDTAAYFQAVWSQKRILTVSNRNLEFPTVPIRVSWGDLQLEDMLAFLQIDARIDHDLYSCLVSNLVMAKDQYPDRSFTFREFCKVSFQIARSIRDGRDYLPNFSSYEVNRTLKGGVSPQAVARYHALIERLVEHAVWLTEDDIVEGVQDVEALLVQQVLDETSPYQSVSIDLQSIDHDFDRHLVVSRLLSALWMYAREKQADRISNPSGRDTRIPVFIVIEEAHNLIPVQTEAGLLQSIGDQLVRVAAEGRKYGLFLLLSSQRPRKLNPNVVSECGNLCLLRMSNRADLRFIAEILGFVSFEEIDRCLTFAKGHVLLAGGLTTDAPLHMRTLPRRTSPGGSDLGDFWLKDTKL